MSTFSREAFEQLQDAYGVQSRELERLRAELNGWREAADTWANKAGRAEAKLPAGEEAASDVWDRLIDERDAARAELEAEQGRFEYARTLLVKLHFGHDLPEGEVGRFLSTDTPLVTAEAAKPCEHEYDMAHDPAEIRSCLSLWRG
ncbi:MAG: hypothetical protein QM729_21250 [Solirubrobacterales bacterium]